MAWNGNNQREIGIRSNTNHAAKALEKLWFLQAQNRREAEIWHNILDAFRGSQPLCDCLLILCGAEENPDFIL